MAAGGMKAATWVIRLFQLWFAIILVGIISYMIGQYNHYGFSPPRELVVPEVFSVIAIVTTTFGIASVVLLSYSLQLVAAFLDFVMFIGYIASSSLLHSNYYRRNSLNPLRNSLITMRIMYGDSPRVGTTNGLVRLLVSLVTIQVILYFTTALLGLVIGWKMSEDPVKERRRKGGACRGVNV